MKKILTVLLLSCTALWAQVPPPAGLPARPGFPGGAARGIPAPAATPADAADATEPGMTIIAPTSKINLSEAELNKVYGKDEINFTGMDINQFLTVYAETVNRTILRPATLPAPTITVQNQTPLTRREVIQLFDAVLGMNGIVMINVDDKFVKAMPVAEAAGGGARIEHGDAKSLPELGQYVTHVVQLQHVKPSEILQVIQPFARIPNSILPIEGNNILVIRDYAENVKRMLEMIEQVDVMVPQEYISEVIPIKYALASDISSALSALGGGGGTTVGSSGGGAARGTSTSSRGRSSGLGGGIGMGNMAGNMAGNTGANTMGGIGAQGASRGGTFTDRLRNIIQRASGPASASGEITVLGETKIIADERTNALLVYATREDMATIKDIISKLDVVLAQVLIESIILSVSANDSLNFGISAAQNPKQFTPNFAGAGVVNNDKDLIGKGTQWFSNLVPSNSLSSTPSSGGLSYFGNFGGNWDVALQALASDGKTEVIQKPVIMTTHATPGHFFVGDTVPYVTSTYYGGGYGGGPSSSYQQLRVGIDINVTPFINPDGIVVMKIDQSIEQLNGSVPITGVGDVPKTSSRTLSADITVSNRDTIILGGFITSTGTKNKSGVPLLKDIPVLGALFRSTSNSKDRNELVVLMRPTVLDTPHMAAVGSREVQDNMPGISRFEKRLNKEDKDFQNKMDRLDGVKPAKSDSGTPPASSSAEQQPDTLRQALRRQESILHGTPTPAETTAAPVPEQSQTPESAPVEIQEPPTENQAAPKDWSKTGAAPTPQKTGTNPFKTAQPMTEEELKAFGRVPANQ